MMFLKRQFENSKDEELSQTKMHKKIYTKTGGQPVTIHENKEQKMIQFNGIVLLNGYMRRIYIYHEFDTLMNKRKEDLVQTRIIGYINQVSAISDKFEKTMAFEIKDMNRLLVILKETRKLMLENLRVLNLVTDDLDDNTKLAITAAAVCGEKYINDGIINMGRLFDPEMKKQFMQRRPFFEKRVYFINQLVEKRVNGESLIVDEVLQLEKWFKDVLTNKGNILPDFDVIRRFFEGKRPE